MACQTLSHVYFFVSRDHSSFKVGVSLNPLKRISQISENIDVERSFQFSCRRSDAFRAEKSIHFLFDKYRLNKNKSDGYTEWFDFSAFDEIQKFVRINQDKFKWIAYGSVVPPAEVNDIRYISAELTLEDRRIYNMLLANAWANISEPIQHAIYLHNLRLGNNNNARPRGSFQRLMKAVIAFDVVEDGIKHEVQTKPLGPCKLDYNAQGLVYYTFPEPIRAAVELSTLFARLRRDLLCQFRSKYALSLYEMVQKRVNLSFKTSEDFTLDDLRQKLGVEKGLYPAYRSLNQKVILPAKNEVNEISDVFCELLEIKEGRKVFGLRLSWSKKETDETVKNAPALPKAKSARVDRPALRVVGNETEAGPSPNTGKRLRELNTRECEQLKKTFFGYDIYQFYIEFQDWLERTGGEIPKNPAAAFTNWLKSYYKITGPLQR